MPMRITSSGPGEGHPWKTEGGRRVRDDGPIAGTIRHHGWWVGDEDKNEAIVDLDGQRTRATTYCLVALAVPARVSIVCELVRVRTPRISFTREKKGRLYRSHMGWKLFHRCKSVLITRVRASKFQLPTEPRVSAKNRDVNKVPLPSLRLWRRAGSFCRGNVPVAAVSVDGQLLPTP